MKTNEIKTSFVPLMASLAILALFLAIVYGNFVKRRRTGTHRTCVWTLRSIDMAKRQWALDLNKAPTAFPTMTDLVGRDLYLKFKPRCPIAGTYTLNAVNQKPTCSLSASNAHSL